MDCKDDRERYGPEVVAPSALACSGQVCEVKRRIIRLNETLALRNN